MQICCVKTHKVISTENLQFSYPNGGVQLRFPDISLDKGEELLILGKSGIGKTTLLHLLAGLLQPSTGIIKINGTTTQSLSNRKMDQFRGENIGIVFQRMHTIPSLTVIETLKLRLYLAKKKKPYTHLDTILKQLNLSTHKNHRVTELSTGQLQRLGIACAVIHSPSLILADEPTSSLDDDHCNQSIELLKSQAKQSQSNLIIITHDTRITAAFDTIITL